MKANIQLTDTVYGSFTITSPVLIELIASKAVQRLKRISQNGLPNEYYYRDSCSRYDHSVGVMILLKKLGASEKEQIAGLLHDVSHTAFSHLIDWLLGTSTVENFQDNNHESYISKSEIPAILEKYHYDCKEIVDYKHFGMLEQPLPDICADRIDYTLRELDSKSAKMCLDGMIQYNDTIVFRDIESAHTFATSYLFWQMNHWSGYESPVRYEIFSRCLKKALDLKLITFDDFWKDEDFILDKLQSSEDTDIQKYLMLLKNRTLTHLSKGSKVLHSKWRAVDPKILIKNKLFRLSSIDEEFKNELEKAKQEHAKGIIMPVVS